MARKFTLDFLKTEAGSGVVLGLAAVAALIVANSPLSDDYFTWLKSEHLLQVGPLAQTLSVSEWIKEGLMAVFFLVVGLEIKYEIMRGELSDPRKLATPVLAALGKPQMEITASAEVESATPFREGSAASSPAISRQDVQRARRQFEHMTRRMPREMRDALQRDFESYLKQAQAGGQDLGERAQVHRPVGMA